MPTGGALRAGALALAPSVHGRGLGRALRGPFGTPGLSRRPPTPQRAHPSMLKKQKSNKAKCRRREASEALKAETPVPKEADQKRSRLRQMPCCNSPLLPSRQQKRPCSADRRSGTSRAPCRSYGEVQIGFASRRPPSSVMARGRFFCLQCPFPFVCSLCTKQAEQGSKTLCVFNAMPFA